MTPEEEIERIKRDFADHWSEVEKWPGIQKALAEKDPIKLAELAAMGACGNYQDKGVASQARHSVRVLFTNGELVEFESLEQAKKNIAYRAANSSLGVELIERRLEYGHWETITL